MRFGSVITILASVLLSIAATLFVVSRPVSATSNVLQGRTLELTDTTGKVRVRIAAVNSEGRDRPEITLLDATGRPSVLLSSDQSGQSTLYFSSPDKEGKVALGYIWGSDVRLEATDPFAMWGMRVLGKNGQIEAIGIGTDGKLIHLDR